MANCHKNFFTATESFHSKIVLDERKKESLRRSRRNLKDHIKKKFEEKDRPKIVFWIQGSFSMDTTVNPLNGDYDIDYGLYFNPELDERPTPDTVHRWVVEAVKSYNTVDPPIDKSRCVRVQFKAGYHVDIPIYDLVDPGEGVVEPYLAIIGEGWEYSDPKLLTQWFNNRVSEKDAQLRRLVRYFKAWADYQSQKTQTKMPSGLILTILTAEEYQYDERDDVAFARTAAAILDRINDDESIPNPVDKNEDLRERITDVQFDNFRKVLDELIQNAETALEHESAEEAAKRYWRKVLGDRFPVIEDDPGKKCATESGVAPGIIGIGSESA